uniref:SET domain-containing protein n=1 Tax=Steinernema glaseri TaxID=37863 RepID=A0A1I8APH0_9BILA
MVRRETDGKGDNGVVMRSQAAEMSIHTEKTSRKGVNSNPNVLKSVNSNSNAQNVSSPCGVKWFCNMFQRMRLFKNEHFFLMAFIKSIVFLKNYDAENGQESRGRNSPRICFTAFYCPRTALRSRKQLLPEALNLSIYYGSYVTFLYSKSLPKTSSVQRHASQNHFSDVNKNADSGQSSKRIPEVTNRCVFFRKLLTRRKRPSGEGEACKKRGAGGFHHESFIKKGNKISREKALLCFGRRLLRRVPGANARMDWRKCVRDRKSCYSVLDGGESVDAGNGIVNGRGHILRFWTLTPSRALGEAVMLDYRGFGIRVSISYIDGFFAFTSLIFRAG